MNLLQLKTCWPLKRLSYYLCAGCFCVQNWQYTLPTAQLAVETPVSERFSSGIMNSHFHMGAQVGQECCMPSRELNSRLKQHVVRCTYFTQNPSYRHPRTWVALLSEASFSPEDWLSLLALGALSEVSEEGVLLPEDTPTSLHQHILKTNSQRPTHRAVVRPKPCNSYFSVWFVLSAE